MIPHEELLSIFQNHFLIDPKTQHINFEIIERSTDIEKFDRILSIHREQLASHPNKDDIKKKLYLSDNYIIYIQYTCTNEEVEGINPKSLLYYPVCTIDEIKAIENPKSAHDQLLKYQADAIADHSRLTRIFLARRSKCVDSWSLTKHFYRNYFNSYMKRLSISDRSKCQKIAAGFSFIIEPNGYCIKSKFGNIIILSESLEFYLRYMNLFIFGPQWGVEEDVVHRSLLLASRIMLEIEAPDFDLDPRDDLNHEINSKLLQLIRNQTTFIIGHEYAHALLGHLDKKTATQSYGKVLSAFAPRNQVEYYTPQQQQEMEADFHSIMRANYSNHRCAEMLNAAILFFIGLHIHDAISNHICPPVFLFKSHPDPVDRITNLVNRIRYARKIDDKIAFNQDQIDTLIAFANQVRSHLINEYLPFNIENFEALGSIYLENRLQNKQFDRMDY